MAKVIRYFTPRGWLVVCIWAAGFILLAAKL